MSPISTPAGDVTVTLSVDSGALHVEAGTSGVDVNAVFLEEVILTGTIAEIQALLGSDPTSVVTYTADTDYPSPDAELTVTIDDGTSSASDTATILITAVNDAPGDRPRLLRAGTTRRHLDRRRRPAAARALGAMFDDDNDASTARR